jgi:hypothetical protein
LSNNSGSTAQEVTQKDKVAAIYYSGLRTTDCKHQRPVFESISRQSTSASLAIFVWPSVRTDLRKFSFLFQDFYQMSTNNGQKTERRGSCAAWVCSPLNVMVLDISTTII